MPHSYYFHYIIMINRRLVINRQDWSTVASAVIMELGFHDYKSDTVWLVQHLPG